MKSAVQKSNPAKMVTAVALGSIFLYSFAYSTTSVMVNEVVDGFSLSGASEGMMGSVYNLGTMLALFAAPLLQGRVAKMTVLLFATAMQAAALAFCGLSPVFSLFCLCCAIAGMGGGLVDTYTNSLLVDVHKRESTRYLGYLHGLFGTGSLLAPLCILWLLRRVSWRGVYYALALLVFLGGAVLYWLARRAPHTETAHATRETVLSWHDLREYAVNRRNMAVLAATVFATATQTGILLWTLRYMTLRFNAEALGAASISLYWVCATLNRFTISRVRMTPVRLLIIGGALAALCLGLGVLSDSAWGMFAAMGALGLCTGHFMQVLFSEGTKGYEGKTTFATSVLIVVMGLTRSVVPLVMAGVSVSLSVVVGMLVPALTALGTAVSGGVLARLDARLPGAPGEGA